MSKSESQFLIGKIHIQLCHAFVSEEDATDLATFAASTSVPAPDTWT